MVGLGFGFGGAITIALGPWIEEDKKIEDIVIVVKDPAASSENAPLL